MLIIKNNFWSYLDVKYDNNRCGKDFYAELNWEKQSVAAENKSHVVLLVLCSQKWPADKVGVPWGIFLFAWFQGFLCHKDTAYLGENVSTKENPHPWAGMGVISNQFEPNSRFFEELLFLTFIYQCSPADIIRLSVIWLEHEWNGSGSDCAKAACVLRACIHSNQEENEWMCVLFLLGFTYWADNLFQLRRAVALVTAEGGPMLRWIKSPFENNQDWLIVAGREHGVFQEWMRMWGCWQAGSVWAQRLRNDHGWGWRGGLGERMEGEQDGCAWSEGAKLIMWLRLIRWRWGKSVM